jgi:hypothetical protein
MISPKSKWCQQKVYVHVTVATTDDHSTVDCKQKSDSEKACKVEQ